MLRLEFLVVPVPDRDQELVLDLGLAQARGLDPAQEVTEAPEPEVLETAEPGLVVVMEEPVLVAAEDMVHLVDSPRPSLRYTPEVQFLYTEPDHRHL